MTKLYALLLLATSFSFANAQTGTDELPFKEGDKLLGGSVGYSLQRQTFNNPVSSTPTPPSNSNYRYVSFRIAPSIGFFTKPNRLVGFSLNFNYGSSLENINTYDQKNTNYGAAYYKQFWNSLGKNFYFIIQGELGGSFNHQKYAYTSQIIETNGASAYFSIAPGFAYRMKRRLILDVYYSNFLLSSFTYARNKSNGAQITRNYIFSTNTGLRNFALNDVVFGFRYLL
jgi:hypothetical protein